jgi:hypothetical protein
MLNLLNFFTRQEMLDFGLLTDLREQAGNDGQLYARINYNGAITGNFLKGTYNPATTYQEGERVAVISGNPYFQCQALSTLTGGAHPNAPSLFEDNASWKRCFSGEVLMDLDDGTYMRYSLGFNQDDFIRWNKIERGTLSQTAILASTGSIEFSTNIGASASGVVVSAVPQSLSYTIPTGLSNVWDKVSVGTSSSSMSILASGSTPTFVNVTLATGQSLSTGDALKLENTSTNFNIARVITYNSGTGAAYLAIINGVGSGTHTSWDVYKVSLVYATWDAAPTSVYVHGLVDTYDSGTGAITITTFVQLGASGTTRTTWTFFQGRQAPVGRTNADSEVHQNGAILGQMVRGVYKNNSLAWRSNVRNEATGWKIIILEGPDAGEEFTIDCYNASFIADQLIVVSNDLAPSPKDGYAFIAFSITSPSGSSTNTRATVRHSTNTASPQSFNYRAYVDVFTPTIPIAGQGDSSGELAWTFKENGSSDDLYWLPDHNFDRISFESSPPVISIDGTPIDKTDIITNLMAYRFQPITSFGLVQELDIDHPDTPGSGTMLAEHTIDSYGLHYKITINTLYDWLIGTGYEHMIAFPQTGGGDRWFDVMETDLEGTFTWPGGTSPQTISGDQIGWRSAIFKSTNSSYTDNEDFALALWVADNFWRIGQTGKGTDTFGYSGGPKLYPRPFNNFVLVDESTRVIEGRLFAGFKGTI